MTHAPRREAVTHFDIGTRLDIIACGTKATS